MLSRAINVVLVAGLMPAYLQVVYKIPARMVIRALRRALRCDCPFCPPFFYRCFKQVFYIKVPA